MKKCIFQHDRCRITSKYDHAGQNIAIKYTTHKEKDVIDVIKWSMKAWWDEYMDVPEADITRLIENYQFQ